MKYRLARSVTLGLVASIASSLAYATNVSVDCDKSKNEEDSKEKSSITGALAKLSKQGPHTVTVSGTCNESVLIQDFDNLTLIGRPEATINDPVADGRAAVHVELTRLLTVDGFTINGVGNPAAVICGVFASCLLDNNIIQGSPGFAVFIGRHSSAALTNTTIQDSGGGLLVTFGGDAVMFDGGITGITGGGEGLPAVEVSMGSLLRIQNLDGPPVPIQYDTGLGVSVSGNAMLRLQPGAVHISGNGGPGIVVDHGSVAEVLGSNAIANNGENAIVVGESSFVFIDDTVEISGNTGDAVACDGTFSNSTGQFPCSNL